MREGRLEDAADMAYIFNHYVRTSDVIFSEQELGAAEMRRKLEPVVAGGFPFWVETDENDRVTGYCYAHLYHPDPVYHRTWELTEYMDKDSVGRGTGTRLLARTIEDCRSRGCHTVVAMITAGNEACERMVRRAGLVLTGTIRDAGYKFGRYLDDAVYQRIL